MVGDCLSVEIRLQCHRHKELGFTKSAMYMAFPLGSASSKISDRSAEI